MHLVDVVARLPRHLGHRRRGHPAGHRRRLGRADPQAGPGRPLLLRRRRVQAGRVRRVAERRLAVEAADRLRDGEQRLQRRHALGAGGRERGRRRAAVGQGQGVQHARRHGRRRATRSRSTRRSAPRWRAPARGDGPDARRVEVLPPLGARQHHRPARRAAALPRARGDRGVRRPRGVRGGAARRPGPALPRPARHRRHADRRAGRPDHREVRDEMQEAVDFGLESPCRSPKRRSTTSTPRRRRHGTRTALHRRHRRGHQARDGARRHASSTSGRTSPRPRTTASSTRSARTACASRRSPRPPRSAWPSAPRWPASARSSSSTWPSSCSSPWTRWSTRRRASATCRGGQVKVPLVLKAGYGFTAGWAGQHTGSISALFMGVPGLKVACRRRPPTPRA